MKIERGRVWWVDFGEARGTSGAFRRPALIAQCDAFNTSRIATVVVVPITGNVRLADAPGNVLLTKRRSGLSKNSVINVSQVSAIDRVNVVEHHGLLDETIISRVEDGIRLLLAL